MTARLDTVIHPPTRLSIMALLTTADEADFAFVRDSVGVSDSVLSKHGSALEAAGERSLSTSRHCRRSSVRQRTCRNCVGNALGADCLVLMLLFVSYPSGLMVLCPRPQPLSLLE